MGLFGKKKAKTDAADEMFKQFGQETNDIKAPATRKEGKEQVQSAQIAEVKKDQLMDRFNYLRKMMYQHSDFDEYSNRLEDIIVKLRQMPDNENVRARSSVDNFIVNSLKEAVNYCNRGNYIAMGACIDIIDGLVDDRYQCGDYYLDPNFIKFKIQRNKYYIEQQNQQSAYDKLTERMKKLQADANNPNLHVSKENIARQAMQIKAEGKRIQTFLDSLERTTTSSTWKTRSPAFWASSARTKWTKRLWINSTKRWTSRTGAFLPTLSA